jgi:hypothetical protein
MTLAMLGRCEKYGYNLATIWPIIQLIIAIKQGLSELNNFVFYSYADIGY